MSIQQAATVGMPIALAIIMFGVGLDLRLADFARVARFPRAVLIGLGCQLLLLPLVCVAIILLGGLQGALAVGLMLLAASPGGATANAFSHLARGDVALNVSLTALNALLAMFTLPVVVNLSMLAFMGEERHVSLQLAKVMQVFVMVLGPVALGMAMRALAPALTARVGPAMKQLSALILLAMLSLAIWNDRATLADNLLLVGGACLAFNLASMALGYWVPRWCRLAPRQAVAISMEVGIHNATLAITLAMSPWLLDNPTMAVPPAIYSVIMLVTAGIVATTFSRRASAHPVALTD